MNASLAFDQRLWPQDIAQSRAHATMLAARGIIADDERDALLTGLDAVERELAGGTFPFAPGDEDIHMAVERRLTELAGPVGGKLHTARSRNDQVATDVALFTRAAALDAVARIEALMDALVDSPPPPPATRTGRCRATPTCSARSRSTWPTTCSPTSGCSTAIVRGFASPPSRPRGCRSARARLPA
jgi:hypothetical protein